jgi:hypothetical protein
VQSGQFLSIFMFNQIFLFWQCTLTQFQIPICFHFHFLCCLPNIKDCTSIVLRVCIVYQNSFLPSSIKLWNNISNDIRLKSSKYCFKRFLNRNLCKKSYYFNFGSRKEQIIFNNIFLKEMIFKGATFET